MAGDDWWKLFDCLTPLLCSAWKRETTLLLCSLCMLNALSAGALLCLLAVFGPLGPQLPSRAHGALTSDCYCAACSTAVRVCVQRAAHSRLSGLMNSTAARGKSLYD